MRRSQSWEPGQWPETSQTFPHYSGEVIPRQISGQLYIEPEETARRRHSEMLDKTAQWEQELTRLKEENEKCTQRFENILAQGEERVRRSEEIFRKAREQCSGAPAAYESRSLPSD